MVRIVSTAIDGPLIVEPAVHGDDRGFFMETWNARTFAEAGIDRAFVQDNHSRSARGVLRGLHFQEPAPQAKLVRVTSGRAFDVAVDVRRGSASFGRWAGVELSAANKRMFFIPEGFAHGFLSLEDDTDFLYKCSAFYDPAVEHSLRWDDPAIGIEWPLAGIAPIVSAKDAAAMSLDELRAIA